MLQQLFIILIIIPNTLHVSNLLPVEIDAKVPHLICVITVSSVDRVC